MAHYAKIACDTLTMLLKSRTHITELFDWALCWVCIEQKKVCSVIIGYYKLFVGSLLSTFSDPSLSCERDDLMRFSSVWIVQFKVPWMWFRVKKERKRLRFVKEVERERGSKQNKRKKKISIDFLTTSSVFQYFSEHALFEVCNTNIALFLNHNLLGNCTVGWYWINNK